jgi:hypothetical protein
VVPDWPVTCATRFTRTMPAYPRRLTRKRSPLSPEFLCLLLVVVAGGLTAWWAGHLVAMNLSVIQTAASVLGVNETVGSTHEVGYSASDHGPAPYCQSGETPSFNNGLAALHQQVGNLMGVPVECEHAASAGGDTVQATTTGLAAYNSVTNTETFTDGWHHWALSADGLVTWEGADGSPPSQASVPQEQHNQQQ